MDFVKKEPVVTALAIVAAILVLLQEFGIIITPGQYDAIMTLASLVVPIVIGVIVRSKVSPVEKKEEEKVEKEEKVQYPL